ncbi:hypothetical protein [uncultured Granulicatella sp.]|nr:hypothetical protein [uncultured Granulicatella sp.]
MRFDGGILSTVKEYILDKNGEKVKLKNGNYKTRKKVKKQELGL